MKAIHALLESGWISISLSLRSDEIDELIGCLHQLKAGSLSHFHLTRERWSGDGGIADVEFSVIGDEGADDMRVG